MAETNSCYDGGYDGVSNVFAAALWGVDYTAHAGGPRVGRLNFHRGGTGLYTPIATSTTGGTTTIAARPLYYAMLMFGTALGTRPVPVTVDGGRGERHRLRTAG